MASALPNLMANSDPKYSEKINGYQSMIRVLLYNYSLMEKNQLKLTEKEVALYKLKLENHLIKITKKQKRLIGKLLSTKPVLKKGDANRVGGTWDDDGKLESAAVARGISIKDRMAIVRGARRKRRRYGPNSRPNSSKKSSAAAAVCDDDVDDDELDLVLEQEEAKLVLKPGQYNGDVSQEEMSGLMQQRPAADVQQPNPRVIFPAKESTLECCDKTQFVLNIGLLTFDAKQKACEIQREDQMRAKQWRSLTYVPEVSNGKKHRLTYTYLNPEVGSPPMLRARKCQNSRSKAILANLSNATES